MADMDEEIMRTSVDIPPKFGQSRRGALRRMPVHMREKMEHIYEPVVVSLGPYHHLRYPKLELGEQLKYETVDILCGRANNKDFLLGKILERLDEIRHFYGGAVRYDGYELATMMLRDVCLVLYYMEGSKQIPLEHSEHFSLEQSEHISLICHHLGMSGPIFLHGDVLMVENQIPLWLINLLIPLVYQGEPAQSFLSRYLSYNTFGVQTTQELPWGEEEEEPLHLLEAFYRFNLPHLVGPKDRRWLIRNPRKKIEILRSPFRSVTELKAKGIHFRRSSDCLTDIRFVSSAFSAKLYLPIYYVDYDYMVIYSNLIAFEMLGASAKDCRVTSYVNFMKTLIDTASDVKELREKGILHSMSASDEEVVRMFKSINTYGLYDNHLYEVKKRINGHCNSKAKTWISDLIDTKFRTPWTIIALIVATFLLCLTFLQTYYTINPTK